MPLLYMQSAIHYSIIAMMILLGSLCAMNYALVYAANVPATIVFGASPRTTDAYAPYPINAKVGDTVTWTNNDTQPHTVTSGTNGQPDGKFDSSPDFNPLITPQQSFSHLFNETGVYPYYCSLHPNM